MYSARHLFYGNCSTDVKVNLIPSPPYSTQVHVSWLKKLTIQIK